tara:strand:- start:120 stop:287 length:168 start_codon:yes stop_codon:yes gene_type:complete
MPSNLTPHSPTALTKPRISKKILEMVEPQSALAYTMVMVPTAAIERAAWTRCALI